MREIKFRAWDKRAKQMYQVTDLGIGEKSWEKYAENYAEQPKTGYNKFYPEEVEIMQYIGLHDKNGKEIYEGDIIYVISEDENAFILWDKETARYIIQFEGWCADFDNYYGKELEIIGNIYENPVEYDEIDIDSIEELKEVTSQSETYESVYDNREKINELVRAVKKLNNK